MHKRLLVVVDYQNDFVDGSLGFEKALRIEDKIVDRILEFQRDGEDIVFTKDCHDSDYLQTEEGKNLPVPHCIKGTRGAELHGRIQELSQGYPIVEKDTFPAKELLSLLEGKGYREILLCGVVSNICVLSNAVVCKAALPNAHIVLIRECCASNDEALESKAYEVLKGLQVEVR